MKPLSRFLLTFPKFNLDLSQLQFGLESDYDAACYFASSCIDAMRPCRISIFNAIVKYKTSYHAIYCRSNYLIICYIQHQ